MGLVDGQKRKALRRGVRPLARFLLAAPLVCLHAPDLAAQAGTTTGVIRGEVSDPLGNPVPDAAVVIQHRGTDLVTTVETSRDGKFVRTASPASEQCAHPGERANQPSDRICADGSILTRNTLRRDNEFVTWDLRISRSFTLPNGLAVEPIIEVFNLTGADNFLDSHTGSLLFNFDGSLRSGLGDTRRGQLGVSLRF